MNRAFAVIMLVVLMAFTVSSVAYAAPMPVGGCPNQFTLMQVMIHDDMEHTHTGLIADLNGDGYLCMYAATNSIHVHLDNTIRVK